MPPFKDPSFQERVGRAAEAKRKALDNLRSRPPVDEAVAAARREAGRQREVRAEAKRSARAQKAQAADAAADEDAKAAEAAAKATVAPAPPTEAERKAARDARYAARKSRK
jgi:hypothetical protein